MAIGKLLSVWAQLTQHFNESTTLSALSHESHVTFRIASSGGKNGAAHREVNFHISTVPSDLENFAPQG